ncbi:hypothetical protein COU78_01390 [Candidatus Peregrinibacteria bacterium CG10_big_fil_rev_8_21_14_0_10_49_24]|nr:MAG: hypothetical protein COV83_04355 [Candidatus Peregrinibacteria bacterium CG11_big_fil_rev_8_21_14_0_20_49_14]PIR51379.1 MAG: hypothetical protein COU78_01390 [Candidatus Peregrinibacteria bacterium CG10_big_fil_rev_8_21_14_0_10_49_24]PJA68143.1 MAG: hypothetical protein CO157_01205 [Candidatus Peregrinibacteria bacterium CG_4_9_14_3_um_filter_49_12]
MRTLRVLLIIGLVSVAPTASARFWDVPDDHPYGEAIDYIMREGIVRGYPDRSFRADLPISRAEFTKIIVSTLFSEFVIETCVESLPDSKEALDVIRFDDVSYLDWYGPYLCVGILAEIIQGYPDGTFRPEDGINFAEAAKILANSYGILSPERHDIRAKQDVWYKPYVEDLADLNAIPPTIRGFQYPITRGEMAEMIYRLTNAHLATTVTSKRTLTYADLAETIPRLPYVRKTEGFALTYPDTWPPPFFQARGISNDGVPVQRSSWRVYLGHDDQSCPGFGKCNERSFYIDGYDNIDTDLLISDFDNSPYITVLEDVLADPIWTIVYEDYSVGCGSKRALIMTKGRVYRLTALCSAGNLVATRQFDQLLRSFSLIEKKR